jgi:signal transduction histidine kinase
MTTTPSGAAAGPSPRVPRGRLGRLLREPFTRRGWAEFRYALVGLPLAVAGFVYTVASLAAGALASVTLVGLPLLAVSSTGARWFGAVNRNLARRLLAVAVEDPRPVRPGSGFVGWVRSGLGDGSAWRARAYLVLKLPIAVSAFVAAAAMRLGAVWYVLSPLERALNIDTRSVDDHGVNRRYVLHYGGFYFDTWPRTLLLSAIGVMAWWLAPWILRGVLRLDRDLIGSLLSASGRSTRMRALERARAHAVDDSAAMLRRIERDLHDGAQAELLGLAMKLGLAKEKLAAADRELPGQADLTHARQLVDDAHASARTALTELRDLARGVHPPILDQGLDEALSTLAARSAVPVHVDIAIRDRPSAAIETVAYFCVAELLSNVVKHSQARAASLRVTQHGDLIRIQVIDGGVGGATLAGSGLIGLGDRLATVDGQLDLASPPGGPTVVTVELPTHV